MIRKKTLLFIFIIIILAVGAVAGEIYITKKNVQLGEEGKEAGTLEPTALKLEQKLYELTKSEDPIGFATKNKIPFSDGKVKVWISWIDASKLDQERFHLVLQHGTRTKKCLTLELVPIEKLIELSKEPYIEFISVDIRLPNPIKD
jgi:predicted transcriptional regulator